MNTGPAIIGGVEYTALGDTVNAAFRLETATKQLGLGVAIGERTFSGLPPVLQSHFEQRKVALKGYEGESTAWGISSRACARVWCKVTAVAFLLSCRKKLASSSAR